MKNILCLDSGGTMGVITLRFLAEIERTTGKPPCDIFDVFGGTSTGAILGSALAMRNDDGTPKFTIHDLLENYYKLAEKITEIDIPQLFRSGFGLWGPGKSNNVVYEVAKEWFGDKTLGDLTQQMFYHIYDVRSQNMFVLDSRVHNKTSIASAVTASSCVPGYFAPHPCKIEGDNCSSREILGIDGAFGAPNPTLSTYSHFLNTEEKVNLLSVGAGAATVYSGYENWGWVQYILGGKAMNFLIDGNMSASEHIMKLIVSYQKNRRGDAYMRMNIPRSNKMTTFTKEYKVLREAEKQAARYVFRHRDEVHKFCEQLMTQVV